MNKVKNIGAALLLVLCGAQAWAQDALIDVVKYDLHLDLSKIETKTINGYTDIYFIPRTNDLADVRFDLFQLNVDSVTSTWKMQNFGYASNVVNVDFVDVLPQGDTVRVRVYYNGKPKEDPGGFGGFYFTLDNKYAFNMGVNLLKTPHNAGKMWFPCVDNFTDKALFDCYITVKTGNKAVCGGTLRDTVNNGDGSTTFFWSLRDPIPTYLASVAVGDYVSVDDVYKSVNGVNIPVHIYVRPSLKSNVDGSFVNLKAGIRRFEDLYGPYIWERVGYVGVQFGAGAMEHATNISYPEATINGTTLYETLWAHELSHAWFGNLVTCADAGDMWLNEGFARYNEAVFLEHIYDRTRAKDYFRALHRKTILEAHVVDNGYFPVAPVPETITYGPTVYDKGSTVAHTLRGYLGDSAFFGGLRQYFAERKFGNATSAWFRDYLETTSGASLDAFFDGWVFSPGYAHFRLDSFSVKSSPIPESEVTLHLRQDLRHKPEMIKENRVEVLFLDGKGNEDVQTVTFSGAGEAVKVTVPFAPEAVLLDPEERTADARLGRLLRLTKAGPYALKEEDVQLNVTAVPTPATLHITSHLAPPDGLGRKGLRPATRYWTVDGVLPADCKALTRFGYNAVPREGFDDDWVTTSEDSIVLFYRRKTADAWALLDEAVLRAGGNQGSVEVQKLQLGQYAFCIYDASYTVRPTKVAAPQRFAIAPNPAQHEVSISWEAQDMRRLTLLDLNGRSLKTMPTRGQKLTFSVADLPGGVYVLRLESPNSAAYGKLVVTD